MLGRWEEEGTTDTAWKQPGRMPSGYHRCRAFSISEKSRPKQNQLWDTTTRQKAHPTHRSQRASDYPFRHIHPHHFSQRTFSHLFMFLGMRSNTVIPSFQPFMKEIPKQHVLNTEHNTTEAKRTTLQPYHLMATVWSLGVVWFIFPPD